MDFGTRPVGSEQEPLFHDDEMSKDHKYYEQRKGRKMDRIRVTVKGVDREAWEKILRIREVDQRLCGAILTECILEYWENGYEDCGD